MTYDEIVTLSRLVSLLLFAGMFVAILIYTLRPSAKEKFDEHARIPLKED
jgi:cbb3-type cytochrome oxidase subunit 3